LVKPFDWPRDNPTLISFAMVWVESKRMGKSPLWALYQPAMPLWRSVHLPA